MRSMTNKAKRENGDDLQRLAEKIINMCDGDIRFTAEIESLMSEAMDEAYLDGQNHILASSFAKWSELDNRVKEAYAKGRTEGLSRAAEVARKIDSDVIGLHSDKVKLKEKIAAAIKKLAKEKP